MKSPTAAHSSNGPSLSGAVAPAMDGPAWAMLILLAVLWGGSFVFVEIILTEAPVLTLVALRLVLAAVTLWGVVALTKTPVPSTPKIWIGFGVMGLINNVIPFSLIVWGQTEITAGLAAILNATTPIFTALIAGVALADERITPPKIAGLALGFAGVVVMIGPATIVTFGDNLLHQLSVLGAALSYGVAAVFGRRFKRWKVPTLTIATGQLTASSLILVPVVLLIDGPAFLNIASPGVWLAIVANACLSTALAYTLYFSVLKRAGATNVTLVTVLVPVVAVLAGALLLGEAIGAEQLAGMALIFAGLAVVDGRLWHLVAQLR